MLRVGLVGCGSNSMAHMQVYGILSDDLEVVGVCDLDRGRADYVAKRYHICASFTSHEDMFRKLRPDVVDICTPTPTHAKIALDAARNGSHILVEKPMARSSDECRAMIEEAEKNKVSLCVCHNRIFSSSIMKVKEILDERSRKIDLCAIRSRSRQDDTRPWVRERPGGGVLWESGTHAVYVQRYLLGDVDKVFAMSTKQVKGPLDDRFLVILRSRSAALGLIDLSWWQTQAHVFRCQIDTENGEQIDLDFNTEYFTVKKPVDRERVALDIAAKTFDDIKQSYNMRASLAMKYATGGIQFVRRTHLALFKRFVEALKTGSPPPVAGQDGLEAVRTLEAIETSIERGMPVSLRPNHPSKRVSP